MAKIVRNIEREKELLVLLGASGVVKVTSMKTALKWSNDTLYGYLGVLSDRGLVEKNGDNQRNTVYRLTQKGQALFACFVRTGKI